MTDKYRDPFDSTQEREADARTKRFAVLLREQMATENGREFVEKLLSLTGVFTSTFDQDPRVTAYREGRRDMGLHLMKMMEPEDYILMLEESNVRRRAELNRRDGG